MAKKTAFPRNRTHLKPLHVGSQTPRLPLEGRFWIPELPLFLRAYWHHQNICAKAYYRAKGRAAGRLPRADPDAHG